MNLMQGGVLIFHTRAVTWGLGFSCLVQFSACVVVKAKYLLLFICFRMLQCTYLKTLRIGVLTQSFPPRGKLPSFFPPILFEGNVSTLSTFKVEHSLKMVRDKSLRIIKAQISPRWGVEIKADSIVRFYES